MLSPPRMALMAGSTTGSGGSVSQTPWAMLMPPAVSQATVMARISDCTALGARSLRRRDESVVVAVLIRKGALHSEGAPFHLMRVCGSSVSGVARGLDIVQQPEDDDDQQDG